MLELLNYFKEQLNEKGDSILTDVYKLQEGLYIKINQKGEIIKDSLLLVDKKIEVNELYNWYKVRDIYTETLPMPKGRGFYST